MLGCEERETNGSDVSVVGGQKWWHREVHVAETYRDVVARHARLGLLDALVEPEALLLRSRKRDRETWVSWWQGRCNG